MAERETQYRKDPITGDDYINFGGERVPVFRGGYRVEMRHPQSDLPSPRQGEARFIVPADSAGEAIKKARKLYPGYKVVDVRQDR